jgi:hypothetical protein
MDNTFFLLSSCEHHGCWVGVSETIGNFMTFKILTDNMKKIIHDSNIHSACDLSSWNLWMDPFNDEPHGPSASLPHGEHSMDSMIVKAEIDNNSVGRSDTNKGWMLKESHTYEKHPT